MWRQERFVPSSCKTLGILKNCRIMTSTHQLLHTTFIQKIDGLPRRRRLGIELLFPVFSRSTGSVWDVLTERDWWLWTVQKKKKRVLPPKCLWSLIVLIKKFIHNSPWPSDPFQGNTESRFTDPFGKQMGRLEDRQTIVFILLFIWVTFWSLRCSVLRSKRILSTPHTLSVSEEDDVIIVNRSTRLIIYIGLYPMTKTHF